jgi:hypothetical protein
MLIGIFQSPLLYRCDALGEHVLPHPLLAGAEPVADAQDTFAVAQGTFAVISPVAIALG